MPKLTEELAGPLRQMQVGILHLILECKISLLTSTFCTVRAMRNYHPNYEHCPFILQESARRIGKVSEEAKLEIDVETYVESFKPHIMDVVFAWANGASFSQICKMTDAFEGNDFLLSTFM